MEVISNTSFIINKSDNGKQFNMDRKKLGKFVFAIIGITITLLLTSGNSAHAMVTIEWRIHNDTLSGTPINTGFVGDLAQQINFTVIDDSKIGGPLSTITVDVTSTLDSAGMTLQLTEKPENMGTFQSKKIVLNENIQKLSVSSTATVRIDDDCSSLSHGNCDPLTIETISNALLKGATIQSETDPIGIGIDLTETGPNTGIFTRTLHFSETTSDAASATIKVTPGDTLTILDQVTTIAINALIIPTSSNVGGISVDIGGFVHATYDGVTTDLEVQDDGAPGRGSGGLIRPDLVLDFIRGFGGGGSSDRTPPLFMFDTNVLATFLPKDVIATVTEPDPLLPKKAVENSIVELPFTIDSRGFVLNPYASTIETQTAETGKQMNLRLILNDETGIKHLAFYTNMQGNQREISDSDTYVVHAENQPLEITDPHGLFSNVNFTEYETGTKYVFNFNLTFAKPMDTSNIIFRTWDDKLNSADIKIFDAIKVVGAPIEQPLTFSFVSEELDIPYYKIYESTIPVHDEQGNINYYNSFGDLETKRIHPSSEPFNYPEQIGHSERHNDGFWNQVVDAKKNAFKLAEKLIIDPFVNVEEKKVHDAYSYPDNIGKLDRQKKDTLVDSITYEKNKAIRFFTLYKTNHIDD